MRVLITGGRGQLAADLRRLLGDEVIAAPGREDLNIGDAVQVGNVLSLHRPDVVVNCAAFNRVDVCESEPEQSFAINAAAPQRLAAHCREHGILLVHFSTDYVFAGNQSTPYQEGDQIGPVNVYGASKAAGELAIRCTTDQHLIIRTTGLYGAAGVGTRHGNFVETMLRLAAGGQAIAVTDSQILTPTFTEDVAQVMCRLVRDGASGTYHVTNGGQCSWYEFACEIFRLAGRGIEVARTNQAERPTPARRPPYSVLAHAALLHAGIPEPRHWQEALGAYLAGR